MHENKVSHSRHIKSFRDGDVGKVLRFSAFVALVGVLFVLLGFCTELNQIYERGYITLVACAAVTRQQ